MLDKVGDTDTLSIQGYYSDQSLADLALDLVTYESSDSSVVSVTAGWCGNRNRTRMG